MGQDPDTIRREIEQTRERMGETVEALGYKADVPSRTKEKVSGTFTGVKDRIVGAADSVNESTPSTGDVKQAAQRGASVAQENPLGLALGSVAVGFVAGMLIPATRVEDEKLGEASDAAIEKVKETGQDALEHGKQVAQDAAQTAKESGQEHAQQVKESAQQEGSSSGGPSTPTYTTH